MLTLGTAIRCSVALNKTSKTVFKYNSLSVSRNFSAVRLIEQPVLVNNELLLKRNYASVPGDDVKLTDLERVYYGTLTPRMRAVKVFSLTTSMVGFAAQPILMEQGTKIGGTGMGIFLCCFGGFFTFVTPLLLHLVTKKYVTEIHYNPATGEYIATTINIILQRIQTKFHPSDVKVPEVPGMFTSFNVGKKSFFVDPALFEDPEHYVRIMGFDKPIDFKLNLEESVSPEVSELDKSKNKS